MIKSVDDNLVAVRAYLLEPGAKIGIGQRAPLPVIIRNHEERTGANLVSPQFREDALDASPGRRSDIMN